MRSLKPMLCVKRFFLALNLRTLLEVTVLLLASFVLFISCVTPINPSFNEGEEKLVVEGWITNQDGPYKVKLTKTASYRQGGEGVNLGVKGAKAWIEDDLGNNFSLSEEPGGNYFTDKNFKGEVGRSYRLNLDINESVYQSDFEKIIPVHPIDTVYSNYVEETFYSGFDVYIDFKDPENENNYYKWSWESYEIKTLCNEGGEPAFCCETCWSKNSCITCIDLMADLYLNGKTITQKKITSIPYSSRGKVSIKVFQQSISKEAYKFLDEINRLTNNSGSTFDPPPFLVEGNIKSVANPDEVVLGFFGASEVFVKYAIVRRDYVTKNPVSYKGFPSQATGCVSCIENYNTTLIPPLNWND